MPKIYLHCVDVAITIESETSDVSPAQVVDHLTDLVNQKDAKSWINYEVTYSEEIEKEDA